MNELYATVFNIQKFCTNDGPGIRTTVFIKGCPLNCAWCHNPESKLSAPELMYDGKKCGLCGKCIAVCPEGCHRIETGVHTIDREKCIACAKCTEVCLADALEMAGKRMTVDEVMHEVMKDKTFYDTSGGGITVSGGEPMLHFDFTYALLKKAKAEGLHTAMETCGFAPEKSIRKIAEVTDLFLYDRKLSDSVLHKKYTGVDDALILNNLKMLNGLGARIVLRCPVIPRVNDNDEHFQAIAKLANELDGIIGVDVEPYHPLGDSKNERLGRSPLLQGITFPQNDETDSWIKKISTHTSKPVQKG